LLYVVEGIILNNKHLDKRKSNNNQINL
jgi:hypothetical protein